MVTSNTVFIVAIITLAVVVIVIALVYVGRLRNLTVNANRKGVKLDLDAQPDKNRPSVGPAPSPQDGKTVLDNDLLVKSRVDVPEDADLKVRGSKFFGSPITVRDRKDPEVKGKDNKKDGRS